MIRTQWQQSLVDDLLEWYITIIAGNRELSEAGGLLWNTKKIHAYETIALIHQLKHFYCIVYVLFNRQFKSIEYDCFLDMRISISFEDIKCSFTLFFSGAPLGRGPLNGWNKNLKNCMKYIHHVHFPHIAPQNHLNCVCRRTLLWGESRLKNRSRQCLRHSCAYSVIPDNCQIYWTSFWWMWNEFRGVWPKISCVLCNSVPKSPNCQKKLQIWGVPLLGRKWGLFSRNHCSLW